MVAITTVSYPKLSQKRLKTLVARIFLNFPLCIKGLFLLSGGLFLARRGELDDLQLASYFDESTDGLVKVLLGVGGRDLGADARFSLRDDGVEKPDCVNVALEEFCGEFLGERRIAEEDGRDGVIFPEDLKTRGGHLFAKIPGVRFDAVAKFGSAREDFENLEGGGDDGWSDGI